MKYHPLKLTGNLQGKNGQISTWEPPIQNDTQCNIQLCVCFQNIKLPRSSVMISLQIKHPIVLKSTSILYGAESPQQRRLFFLFFLVVVVGFVVERK